MAEGQEIPRLYTLQQINAVISKDSFMRDLLDVIREGFRRFNAGDFNACPIQTMGAPPMAPFVDTDHYAAQTCVKSGYLTGESHYVIKVASGGHPFPNSVSRRNKYMPSPIRSWRWHWCLTQSLPNS